jgi:hypothetical protein
MIGDSLATMALTWDPTLTGPALAKGAHRDHLPHPDQPVPPKPADHRLTEHHGSGCGGPAGSPGRTGGDEAADASVAMVTRCGRTPELRPVEYRAESGALVVMVQVKAGCPGGDVVSTNRLRATIRDDRGLICSATFDFTQAPPVGDLMVKPSRNQGLRETRWWSARMRAPPAVSRAPRDPPPTVVNHR